MNGKKTSIFGKLFTRKSKKKSKSEDEKKDVAISQLDTNGVKLQLGFENIISIVNHFQRGCNVLQFISNDTTRLIVMYSSYFEFSRVMNIEDGSFSRELQANKNAIYNNVSYVFTGNNPVALLGYPLIHDDFENWIHSFHVSFDRQYRPNIAATRAQQLSNDPVVQLLESIDTNFFQIAVLFTTDYTKYGTKNFQNVNGGSQLFEPGHLVNKDGVNWTNKNVLKITIVWRTNFIFIEVYDNEKSLESNNFNPKAYMRREYPQSPPHIAVLEMQLRDNQDGETEHCPIQIAFGLHEYFRYGFAGVERYIGMQNKVIVSNQKWQLNDYKPVQIEL